MRGKAAAGCAESFANLFSSAASSCEFSEVLLYIRYTVHCYFYRCIVVFSLPFVRSFCSVGKRLRSETKEVVASVYRYFEKMDLKTKRRYATSHSALKRTSEVPVSKVLQIASLAIVLQLYCVKNKKDRVCLMSRCFFLSSILINFVIYFPFYSRHTPRTVCRIVSDKMTIPTIYNF